MPWYDLEDIRAATDRFWSIIAKHLRRHGVPEVPPFLDRRTPIFRQWRHPGLLLSQACGYNVVTDCARLLRVIATPCFTAPGCTPGRYRSLLVVREDSRIQRLEDLRGKVCAVNNISSHSGSNALLRLVEPLRIEGSFFASVRISGAHINSARMVTSGEADVASIDCITFELLCRNRRALVDRLRVIAWTEDAPAPPYVTSKAADADMVERISTALAEAFQDRGGEDARQEMLLGGIVSVPLFWYGALVPGRH